MSFNWNRAYYKKRIVVLVPSYLVFGSHVRSRLPLLIFHVLQSAPDISREEIAPKKLSLARPYDQDLRARLSWSWTQEPSSSWPCRWIMLKRKSAGICFVAHVFGKVYDVFRIFWFTSLHVEGWWKPNATARRFQRNGQWVDMILRVLYPGYASPILSYPHLFSFCISRV